MEALPSLKNYLRTSHQYCLYFPAADHSPLLTCWRQRLACSARNMLISKVASLTRLTSNHRRLAFSGSSALDLTLQVYSSEAPSHARSVQISFWEEQIHQAARNSPSRSSVEKITHAPFPPAQIASEAWLD